MLSYFIFFFTYLHDAYFHIFGSFRNFDLFFNEIKLILYSVITGVLYIKTKLFILMEIVDCFHTTK